MCSFTPITYKQRGQVDKGLNRPRWSSHRSGRSAIIITTKISVSQTSPPNSLSIGREQNRGPSATPPPPRLVWGILTYMTTPAHFLSLRCKSVLPKALSQFSGLASLRPTVWVKQIKNDQISSRNKKFTSGYKEQRHLCHRHSRGSASAASFGQDSALTCLCKSQAIWDIPFIKH